MTQTSPERTRFEARIERRFLSAGGTPVEWREQCAGILSRYFEESVLAVPVGWGDEADDPDPTTDPVAAEAAVLLWHRRL